MRSIGRLVDVVLDCSEPKVLAAFWQAVLGLPMKRESDDWVSLVDADDRPRVSFQRVDEYRPPRWPGQEVPQQLHLDVLVDDLASADAAVVALGATPLSDLLDPDDGPWRIYADPQGHPFCLVSRVSDD